MKTHLQKTVKYRSFFFKSVLMTVIAFVWAMNAQAQEVQWKKNFGGSDDDYFQAVTAVSDGIVYVGYSHCGNANTPCSFGSGDWEGFTPKGDVASLDATIVKYDNAGNVIWQNTFGGGGSYASDLFYSVTAVSDGIVAVGTSSASSFGTGDWESVDAKGESDAIIVKFDNNGNVVWKKNFGGSYTNSYHSVTAVSGGVVAAGRYSYEENGHNAVIVKYDNDGNIVWEKYFGGNHNDYYYGVTAVSDGIVAVGYSSFLSFGSGDWEGITGKGEDDVIIVKYNNDGEVVWKRNFGGIALDRANAVTAVADGIVVVGHSLCNSYGCTFDTGDWEGVAAKGDYDATIVKFDNNGNIVWKNNFGGSYMDFYNSVTALSDGVVAVGYSSPASFGTGDWTGVVGKGGNLDAIIVKYDNAGNVVWKKNFGGNREEIYYDVTTVSNDIVAVGISSSIGNGDWAGVAGKGLYDAIIVKYANDSNTDTNEITLSQLSISAGTLNPAFNPAVYNYTVHVDNSVSSIDITAMPANPEATISGDTGTLLLNVGANPFTITVTEEEKPAQNYTITVYRAGKTGISETEAGKINIYPNPVKDELTIENGELTIKKITIADLSGKSIQQINGSQKQINVSVLAKGIYFVKIETDKGVVTRKLIKE